jgi:hypothetical protein
LVVFRFPFEPKRPRSNEGLDSFAGRSLVAASGGLAESDKCCGEGDLIETNLAACLYRFDELCGKADSCGGKGTKLSSYSTRLSVPAMDDDIEGRCVITFGSGECGPGWLDSVVFFLLFATILCWAEFFPTESEG